MSVKHRKLLKSSMHDNAAKLLPRGLDVDIRLGLLAKLYERALRTKWASSSKFRSGSYEVSTLFEYRGLIMADGNRSILEAQLSSRSMNESTTHHRGRSLYGGFCASLHEMYDA